MTATRQVAEAILYQIETIMAEARRVEKAAEATLAGIHPNFQKSARNLLHYRAMRKHDLRALQKQLGNMGLSRLAKAEAHVMASMRVNCQLLRVRLYETPWPDTRHTLSIKQSKAIHKANANALLGYRSRGRRSRIMVTLPSEAAHDFHLVRDMVAAGMNCGRINCAHDGPEVWARMIEHVRRASRAANKYVKVAMDLAGPKIRTAGLAPGPRVRKFRPLKDARGRVLQPLEIWIGPRPHAYLPHLPISEEDMPALRLGDHLFFHDARQRKRDLRLFAAEPGGFRAQVARTTFVETGLPLFAKKNHGGRAILAGELPALEQPIPLRVGEYLRLHHPSEPGAAAVYNDKGKISAPAHIGCTAPDIFPDLRPGDPILFDDGKIEGVVREARPEGALIEIVRTSGSNARLGADKGINLPATPLRLGGLTDKDRQDLEFVARHADVVNFSFVNTPDDVAALIAELDRLGATDKLGLILKIETQRAFDNLTEILLAAMRMYPVGVMVARGDLAIECGWTNIGRIQEEILFQCRAAHIPDIWATQVLENLAKKGIPSRAEITDAVMAQRADCVMLNKGPFIIEAIGLLDSILKNIAPYQDKNAPLLPPL